MDNTFVLKELAKDNNFDLIDIIQQLNKIPKDKNIKEKHNKKRWR